MQDLYYARVRGLCADEIKRAFPVLLLPVVVVPVVLTHTEFAECARNRTVSAAWACRVERRGMNTCMVSNATPEQRDAARQEWFRRRLEKRRSVVLERGAGKGAG